MGEFPARIFAHDFLIPPELSRWRLASEGSGRIGGARFTLQESLAGARLSACYEQIPIRVMPLKASPGEPALIYLLNPANGLMDGDGHLLEIHAGFATRAVIAGQSATRIHPCLNGLCTQQWKISVAEGATLVVLPGPAIPFRGSRFFQRVEVELARDAQFVWGDLWLSGRYARREASEQFQFECIVQEMRICREGKLIFRDRFCWRGPWDVENARWHFGGFPAAGSVFTTGTHLAQRETRMEEGRTAKFVTAAGDTCLRCTGSSEEVIRNVVENSLHAAALMNEGTCDKPWLLSGHHLARTHWFNVDAGDAGASARSSQDS